MPTPPPRKRFQIHLSTAIVMMFVAGGLMWANRTNRGSYEVDEYVGSDCDEVSFYETSYGWPLTFIHGRGYSDEFGPSIPRRIHKERPTEALSPGIDYILGAINI